MFFVLYRVSLEERILLVSLHDAELFLSDGGGEQCSPSTACRWRFGSDLTTDARVPGALCLVQCP